MKIRYKKGKLVLKVQSPFFSIEIKGGGGGGGGSNINDLKKVNEKVGNETRI